MWALIDTSHEARTAIWSGCGRAPASRVRNWPGGSIAGEWANAFGEITRPIESARFARRSAAEARNQNRARRGALSQAALARAALTGRSVDLDAAVHNANRALDLAVTVQSSRCKQAVTDLRVRIQPFHTVAAARDFDDRARRALATNRQT
ncbi:MAG: hypothetical protein ACRDRZ_00930 [Pseudonocardiaceae bacterium]